MISQASIRYHYRNHKEALTKNLLTFRIDASFVVHINKSQFGRQELEKFILLFTIKIVEILNSTMTSIHASMRCDK